MTSKIKRNFFWTEKFLNIKSISVNKFKQGSFCFILTLNYLQKAVNKGVTQSVFNSVCSMPKTR